MDSVESTAEAPTVTAAATAAAARRLGLIGVPTSAGSHNPGQEKAPAAWRAAGLAQRLGEHGVAVRDFGDLPVTRHQPAKPDGGVRDLDRVAETAARTADAVAATAAEGWTPLVLGGDCTITLGAVAGLAARDADLGLVYFDGDADLSTPEHSDSAVLDTMGVTHLLGGGAPALARLGPRPRLLEPDRLVLLGFDPRELTSGQWGRLSAQHVHATPAEAVQADPVGTAEAALAALAPHAGPILVHFDVDVLDTGAFPLANFPHFHGLTLDQAEAVLARLCAAPAFAGLVVTEANPDHDPDGELMRALADLLARVLSAPQPGGR